MTPIYRTDGEWVAVYLEGHVFSVDGEWIAFVVGREAYDSAGQYIGFLSDDRRLLRKRTLSLDPPHMKPPAPPPGPRVPATVPFAPLMRELPHQIIDVFMEFPDRLLYVAETRSDME